MLRLVVTLFFANCVAAVQSATPQDEMWAAYQSRRWFDLKAAVGSSAAPPFYQGAVAWAFHQPVKAEKLFRETIRANPASREAVEAHRMLSVWYSLIGQYRRAYREYKAILQVRPGDKGVLNELESLKTWARFPEPRLVEASPAKSHAEIRDGDFFVDLRVNGVPSHYLVDTGSNNSFISESEARRAGMKLFDGPGLRTHDAAGNSGNYRVAIAEELVIGGTRLRNVAFLVFSDTRMPFAALPEGWRGALGLPVLLELKTIRWNREGVFETGFTPAAHHDGAENLCFSGEGPCLLVQGSAGGHKVQMVLDIGALKTCFLPYFAERSPPTIRSQWRRSASELRGILGSAQSEIATIQAVAIDIDDWSLRLSPAEVLISRSPFGLVAYDVWLGQDLFSKATEIVIDFSRMRLSIR